MTSFITNAETSTALNPGGFAVLAAEAKVSSSAENRSTWFTRKGGVEAHVQSGGIAERSSAFKIALRPIGTSECSRGAARSFRNFPVKDVKDVHLSIGLCRRAIPLMCH